ncbi:MAG: hypothetical protein PF689_11430 [Deltaproteobacteria bacterium]|jgi:hypothetical protein|nr:hypothetical protein [Deltaproteobacteria bacterium]
MKENNFNLEQFNKNISVVIHNTRGAAGIINSSTELLKRETKSSSVQRYIEMIQRQTQKILCEIELLREVHSNQKKMNCKKINLVDFIFDLTLEYNIEFKIDKTGNCNDLTIEFDPSLIKTIFNSIFLPPTPLKHNFFCKFDKGEKHIFLKFPWDNNYNDLEKFIWIQKILDKYRGNMTLDEKLCTIALPHVVPCN